ncbi:exodeoxyribonuclease III [Aestuariimicrobium sp. p3-SID1156]|uniref:exodeoxyribonuclease III n=1 Tax=Aestuariimicrobium sp. p3-SID1156 TaxID=2916038 RepID=UPI00223AC37C|nr:exodeoxyribonuclease III [Aestuariimicrobium sp. p3-SID1156]MCT1458790.1 exodeoxyribonuclease III [Aestuariimicrobium sp. p3-SID1156]
MRIATFNVNGIRAAQRRGFGAWLERRRPDVVALQEVRCPVAELPLDVLGDYHLAYQSGTLPGRNGVAVMTRVPVAEARSWAPGFVLATCDGVDEGEHVEAPLARELKNFAAHGRYLEVDLADQPLTVASVYVPKGGSPFDETAEKHEQKMRFLAGFARQLARARRDAAARGREFLLMGDINIAHTERDLSNPKGNVKNPGFLPVERDWLGSQLTPRTLVDVVRMLHPDRSGPYSWWSWRGQSWTRDSGWRIDYHLATPALARLAHEGGTDRDETYEARISDHAPVVVDYLPADGPAGSKAASTSSRVTSSTLW